jgi:hypothetical protein
MQIPTHESSSTLPGLGFGWRLAAIGGCLLAIAGCKFLLIARLGSPTPYWDQWLGEAVAVYLPYLSHSLTLDHLLAFHGGAEHRLLLTRVAWLGLLIVNGTWDPIFQMLIAAVVHVAAIGCLLVGLGRVLAFDRLVLLLGFALILCAVPFGWDNTLAGFQIQFYFLLLFSVLSLLLLARAKAWSAPWLLGTFLATLGYFSLASGAVILLAAIALGLVQIALGHRRGAREFAGLALQVVIAAVVMHDLLAYAPRMTPADTSLRQLFSSLMISASWPVAARVWPLVLQIIPALLVQGPILVLTAQMLRQRPAISHPGWFYVAIAAWLALQFIALSLARAGNTTESRFTDIFIVGTILNFAALLWLMRDHETRRALFSCGAALWIFAVTLGAGQKAVGNVIDGVSFRFAGGQRQTENVKQFLLTGDYTALDKRPDSFDIPFPSGAALRDMLANPALRSILLPELTGGGKQHRPLRDAALSQGPMLIPLGLAMLILAAMNALAGATTEVWRRAR